MIVLMKVLSIINIYLVSILIDIKIYKNIENNIKEIGDYILSFWTFIFFSVLQSFGLVFLASIIFNI